jgi:hypothetical protein
MTRLSLFVLLIAASLILVSLLVLDQGRVEPKADAIASPKQTAGGSIEIKEANFVGKEVCRECHPRNFQFHSQSGHAHTLRKASDPLIVEKFVGQSFDAGPNFGTYEYRLNQNELEVRSSKVPDRFFPLEFAFGSGHNAITLATLVPDEAYKTVGMEHRASWFAATQGLAQTPGQQTDPPAFAAEFFGFKKSTEEIAKCIDCHCTTADFDPKQLTVQNLRPNVDCERCHGPGSNHVQEATNQPKNPPAYSVGRDDWTANDEISMCGSCHRMPSEFAPAILREYADVMARFQPVGLLKSKCYLNSDDLRCTTCHNPHQASTVKSRSNYEQSCIRCHSASTSSQTSCPVSPKADCIECHMPRIKFVEGIGFHDHWIRVREQDAPGSIMPEIPRTQTAGEDR